MRFGAAFLSFAEQNANIGKEEFTGEVGKSYETLRMTATRLRRDRRLNCRAWKPDDAVWGEQGMNGGRLAAAFRGLCYVALAALLGSFAVMAILSVSGLCSRIDEGQVACATSAFSFLAQAAMATALLSVFTLAPLALAICGIIFLIRAALRRPS